MTHSKQSGFTLVELMITVAIVGILAGIAMPSYNKYVIRAARLEAQSELLELAGLQEKIFLNSNQYAYASTGITNAYNGQDTGGLGRTSGQTKDGRYDLSLVTLASDVSCVSAGAAATVAGAQTFVLMATPVAGKSQVGDGNICVSENGRRLWGSAAW